MEGTLDSRTAEKMLRQALPAASLVDVISRTAGELSTVYEIRCTGTVPAVIVKIYQPRWRWKLRKEVHIYQLLAQHAIGPVPTILHADTDYLVMSLLPGVPLWDCRFDDDGLRSIYRQLGALLRAVHAIDRDSYGYLTDRILDPLPSNTAYMHRQFDKKLAEFGDLGGDPQLHSGIQHYVAEHGELFAQCASAVLCHNDIHEGNLLVVDHPDGPALTGLIDVENAIAADPLMDLAKADYYAMHGDPAKLSGLIAGYGELPDRWTDRVGVYRLFHALELWDWFAEIGKTARLPGIAADITAMLDG
ncbi:phosphotransferase family protein [Nocardia altamirensis]|uniref:phosphotransferase family protein n=1 Tax=Nocardia altamirensis TaxID=472158 RepID=UPI001C3F5891|nr:aminoglycoside phosphotransferase family protein [Nocardia altamirensis]